MSADSPVDFEERLLKLIAAEAEKQQSAILRQDALAVARSFDALACLMMELESWMQGRGPDAYSTPASAALALRVRRRLRVNAGLLQNGIAAADHLVSCVARAGEAPRAGSPALFSGVG